MFYPGFGRAGDIPGDFFKKYTKKSVLSVFRLKKENINVNRFVPSLLIGRVKIY